MRKKKKLSSNFFCSRVLLLEVSNKRKKKKLLHERCVSFQTVFFCLFLEAKVVFFFFVLHYFFWNHFKTFICHFELLCKTNKSKFFFVLFLNRRLFLCFFVCFSGKKWSQTANSGKNKEKKTCG